MTQQRHSWAFVPEKWTFQFTQKPGHKLHSNFTHNSPKLETTQAFNGQMVNGTLVHPHHGTLLCDGKGLTPEAHSLHGSQGHWAPP